MSRRIDLLIDQGATFAVSMDLLNEVGDPETTSYTATAQIRRHYTSNTAYDFTCSVNNSVLTMSMSSNTTSSIPAGRYVYDVELNDGNSINRALEGVVTVTPQVTR